jgi:hypothetical protein
MLGCQEPDRWVLQVRRMPNELTDSSGHAIEGIG